jgi:hypothetical protein
LVTIIPGLPIATIALLPFESNLPERIAARRPHSPMSMMVRPRPRETHSMHPLLRRLAVLAPLAAAPAALAQGPDGDLLDQTRRLQVVAAQQLEAEVRHGMVEAQRLTDKAAAVERYKGLLQRVEEDKNLPDDRRSALKRVLQDRIRMAETAAAVKDEAAPKGRTQFAENKAAKQTDATPVDAAKVKDVAAQIATLNRQGKPAEAQKLARDLLQKYPDDPSVQVLNGFASAAQGRAEANAVRIDAERRRNGVARDEERSSLPPKDNVEFPKDWKSTSDRRLAAYGPSPAEKAILDSLKAPIQVEFKNARFQDVIDSLSNKMNRTIMLDKNALDEAQITYDTPINFSVKGQVAARTALRGILGQLNLTYVIRDGILQVTNQAKAKDQMVTKVYYIGDLAAGTTLFFPAPHLGVTVDPQVAQNVQAIIDMITMSIEPGSWVTRGGQGMIGYNTLTQSLIIRQSAEVQSMIGSSLQKK